ncbi:hypothetical protein PV326_002895 [Microctonus aethiopoides]|nr:hypothetical protein PV326_002895 [Microctonus aethiopoides]
MWVPVITIAWSIFYLVQSRLRQTKALNNPVSGNLKGECTVLASQAPMKSKVSYARGSLRLNFKAVVD